MATTCSDFIQIQNYLPVYDITGDPRKDQWASFIPTKQFCTLLGNSLTAICSNEPSKRKSVWVRGTFGTGKSHASSVIKHLLCDDLSAIESYLEQIENLSLREQVRNLRQEKRYFPVVLKGVEGSHDIARLSLSLQRATKRALALAGINNIVVNSDFEKAQSWVKDNELIINDIISNNEALQMFATDSERLINRLKQYDADTLIELETCFNKKSIFITQDTKISDWLVEVQQKIQESGIADGLIIFGDEFTSVMDTIKNDRINVLQNIAEKSQDQNVFLFLVSHRTELQSGDLRGKDINKMNDRFENIDYSMDEISTYVIMRHSFIINGGESNKEFLQMKKERTENFEKLILYLCKEKVEEEKKHISNLFPLHPYTAYLCSILSNHIGSSHRSVIKFMHDEESGFQCFVKDENAFAQRQLLTAEWLWDFFYPVFDKDPRCSYYTNFFRKNEYKLIPIGDDYIRVFKVILLLNSLTSKFDTDKSIKRLIPNDENLAYLFANDRISGNIANILEEFDQKKIISRNIFDEFTISVSSFNPVEMEKKRQDVQSQYKTAADFLSYHTDEKDKWVNKLDTPDAKNLAGSLIRIADLQFLGCEESESQLRSRLQKFTDARPNSLHIGLFFSITEESRDMMQNRIKEFLKEFKNTILVQPYEIFTADYRDKFIEALATNRVAQSHFDDNLAAESEKQAKEFVKKWMERLTNGSCTLYLNGEPINEGIMNDIHKIINQRLTVKIFPKGLEMVPKYRTGAVADTFFKTGNFPGLIQLCLQAKTSQNLKKFPSGIGPAQNIFEHNGDNLITDVCLLTEKALQGDSWLIEVCRHMDKCMEDARTSFHDRFFLSEILSSFMRPPYGFFQSAANCVALSYAIRKHKNDLFLTGTSQPVTDEKLKEMLVAMFKMWNDGKSGSNNKLYLRFGSPEEGKLTQAFAEIFHLKEVMNENEIKSLDNAKWGRYRSFAR